MSGFVIACLRATCPTIRSPVFGFTATTEGTSRPPSELEITLASPASIIDTTELVVPRSIPIIFPIMFNEPYKLFATQQHELEQVLIPVRQVSNLVLP